ncbi:MULTISPECIES: BLUF domain-containing protein [Arenibacter]|uniref:BLUF domain-containing protein n=1 Tax=Arenibacter TaxID=178469 RepID=UPI0012FFFE7D|nr:MULTISPECIES: BLUF domain-containing protein [Arenibacter]
MLQNSNMYQLTYSSKASQEITEEVNASILETARNRNKTLGITGCLVFHKFAFVQIIEGDKNRIKSLFDEIRVDKRHYDVKVLWEGNNEERNFSDWNMAYYTVPIRGGQNEEMKNFERNLFLLSELSEASTTALNMFWKSVGKLITKK